MATATTSPARRFPSSRKRTSTTSSGALGQVLADRRDGSVDQLGAVVEGLDPDAGRQRGSQLVELRLHALGHGARVLAEQHEGHADDHLALTVHRRGAAPQARAEAHVADGRHRYRYALRCRADDDRLQVVEALDQAGRADDELFAVALDVPAAGVLVRALERAYHVLDRQPDGLEAFRIDHHLVLLVLAAEAVHLDDAGDGAELRADVPVERLLQLHQRVPFAAHDELIDLAERRRDRAHLGPPVVGGDGVLGLAHPLEDHLAGEVDVGAVLENHGDHRESVLRDRAHLLDLRDAGHGPFDGDGHVLLDLDGGEGGSRGDHLDLDVGDVRDGVDGQVQRRADPQDDEERSRQQHDRAVAE